MKLTHCSSAPWNKLALNGIDHKYLIDAVLCQPPTEQCFFGDYDGCRDELPSDTPHQETNSDISREDDAR